MVTVMNKIVRLSWANIKKHKLEAVALMILVMLCMMLMGSALASFGGIKEIFPYTMKSTESFQNYLLMTENAYDEEYESMPADLQLGVTKRLIGTPFRLSLTVVDLTRWNYSLFRHMVIGADLMLSDQIYLSAGYNLRRAHEMKVGTYDSFGDKSDSSHGAGFSFGGGLILDSFSLGVSYAKYHVSSSSLMINAAFTL